MSEDMINIKGTRHGLVICLDLNHDFDELKRTLKSKIESSRGFFKGAKFTFHLGCNHLGAEKTRELEDICCENGLVMNDEINWTAQSSVDNSVRPIVSIPDSLREMAMADNVRPLMREASPSIPSTGVTASDNMPCLMVNRSLRSGQKINYDGNVVVLGDVNPGADITASGDIVVMGSLRGMVHAGAKGNQESIIMAYRLNPVQLRIGSVISRPPENGSPCDYPEIARLQRGQMLINPYTTYGLK